MTIHSRKIATAGRFGVVGAVAAAFGAMAIPPAAADAPRSASVSAGTLSITGTEGDDRIAVLLAPGAPGTLQLDFDDDGTADFDFDRSTFTSIEVFLRNGDDRFRVNQVNGSFADEALTIHGGNGDDVLDGGDGVELFIAGPGDDAVDGNRGADTAVLGSGNDSFRWDPGDGSDVVEGSSGFDTLEFIGAAAAETMRLSADGGRTLFVREPGNIRMDMDGVERLDLAALGGADTFTIGDLTGTDMTVVDVDLSGPAGGGDALADIVSVNGSAGADEIRVEASNGRVEVAGLAATTRINGSEAIDRLEVNGLDGNDDVEVDGAAAALITVAVDLGPGQV